MQAAGDHQVDDEVEIVLEAQHDALAHAADFLHALALERDDRRHRCAKHERIQQPHIREGLALDARL